MPQGSTPQEAKPLHRILLKHPERRWGVCAVCGPTRLKKKQNNAWACRTRYNQYRSRHSKIKKPHCEACGFVAIHRSQLDVDHIDGNHSNNDPSNLQTLCANCHRLKTQHNEDWKPVV